MLAIVLGAMPMATALPVVKIMRRQDEGHRKYQKENFQLWKPFLQNQKKETRSEDAHRYESMMMPPVAMPQGYDAYYEGEPYHTVFKGFVLYKIYP